MTLFSALTAARQKIDRLDARLLLQYATGCTHTDLLARPETPVIAPAYAQFAEWVERRAAGEPEAGPRPLHEALQRQAIEAELRALALGERGALVRRREAQQRNTSQLDDEAMRTLTETAMHDIAHYLRPAHLAQLRKILDDPEASNNDKFVALDLLKNANIAAGGVLPMCQDTGTAIVMGKRGSQVLTTGVRDEQALSRGVFDAYTRLNLRYSQMAPLTMWEEKNTGSNLPAQIELYADTAPGHEATYKFLFMAKGGGSANKSFLFQETKAILNPKRLLEFLDEKIRSLGTAACPPYHLAVVIGGTSLVFCCVVTCVAAANLS